MEPKDAGIRIDESPRRVLARAIVLSFSSVVKGATYIVTRIIAQRNSISSEDKSKNAMDKISACSAKPPDSDRMLCLISETFDESRIMVAPTRKLVMIISLKLAASTSILAGSNTLASTFESLY